MRIAEKQQAEIDSFVLDVAADFAEEVAEADRLLREIVLAGRRANYSELVYFQKNLGWDETKVRQELRRMTNVVRNVQIAGSPQSREAAEKESVTAESVYEKEAPKLADQIEKLEAKLRSLESDKRISANRVAAQNEAVKQLRDAVPGHVLSEVNQRRNQLSESLLRPILDGRTRLNEIECCLTPSKYPSEQIYFEVLKRSCRDAVHEGSVASMIKYAYSPEWPTIKAAMESELIELREKIATMQSEYDTALSEAEKQLDYYANGEPQNG